MRNLILTMAFCILSVTAQAQVICLQMPIAENNPVWKYEDFRTSYQARVGEILRVVPMSNVQETHYLECSTRLTQTIADDLQDDYPMLKVTTGWPAVWTTKSEEGFE